MLVSNPGTWFEPRCRRCGAPLPGLRDEDAVSLFLRDLCEECIVAGEREMDRRREEDHAGH